MWEGSVSATAQAAGRRRVGQALLALSTSQVPAQLRRSSSPIRVRLCQGIWTLQSSRSHAAILRRALRRPGGERYCLSKLSVPPSLRVLWAARPRCTGLNAGSRLQTPAVGAAEALPTPSSPGRSPISPLTDVHHISLNPVSYSGDTQVPSMLSGAWLPAAWVIRHSCVLLDE